MDISSVIQADVRHAALQDQQLYISDPLALHHILVEDQDVFEETSGFITFVTSTSISRKLFIHDCSYNRMIFGPGLVSSIGKPSTTHLSYSGLIHF
jgi:hypothetical protein